MISQAYGHNVREWGAKGNGSADDTAALQAALSSGVEALHIPAGIYLISSGLRVPANMKIVGDGPYATVLRLAPGANADILSGAGGAGGTAGVALLDLGFDGNDAANTSGRAIAWNTGATALNPAVRLRNIVVQHFRGGANSEAVNFSGSVGVQAIDVNISNNPYARGMFLQAPDCVFTNLYMVSNGGSAGLESLVVRAANSNRFVGAYFGGGSGSDQALVWGGIRNAFLECVNDRAWLNGYRFTDSGAPGGCVENAIVGGVVSNPSQAATNTSDHVLLEGAVDRLRLVGVAFGNDAAAVGRYAYTNVGAGAHNTMSGCTFSGLGTGTLGTVPAGDLADSELGPFSPSAPGGGIQAAHIYMGAAAPVSGTYALGDRVLNNAPAVGQPKGWVCTVAGTPGTWVSEGNL